MVQLLRGRASIGAAPAAVNAPGYFRAIPRTGPLHLEWATDIHLAELKTRYEDTRRDVAVCDTSEKLFAMIL